jgi:hypothetical protein
MIVFTLDRLEINNRMVKISIPRLGIFAHFQDRQAMKLGHPTQEFKPVGSYPPVKLPIDWTNNNTLGFPMDGNDQYGDCMYAAACHADNTFTGNNGAESSFALSAIEQDYFQLSGGNNGLNEGQIIGAWQRGLANTPSARIIGALNIDPTNAATVQAAIYFFGGVLFMLSLPDIWRNSFQTGGVWDAPATPDPSLGHGVWWNGVNTNGYYKLQTWGTYGWITPAGVAVCDPSCFVVFSPRWFNAQGVAPNGKTIKQLAAIWAQFGGSLPPISNWNQMPGGGRDIGVGADGSVWLIGGNHVGTGSDSSPFRWNSNSGDWDIAPGGGVRIAVGPDGMPWMVNSVGSIFHYEGGMWVQKPGGGRDIGVGADGSVWLIGGNHVGTGSDSSPFKWNGRDWDIALGGGVDVSVGPDGTPWITNSVGSIYRGSLEL